MNSVQSVVSDGTLTTIPVSIQYFEPEHIHVFLDRVEVLQGDLMHPWAWDGTNIKFESPITNGTLVELMRITDFSGLLHLFQNGAVFKASSMDENFKQLLYLSEEYKENPQIKSLYFSLDMRNNRVYNVANPINDKDAVNYTTLKQYAYDAGLVALANNLEATSSLDNVQSVVGAGNLSLAMNAQAQSLLNRTKYLDTVKANLVDLASSDPAKGAALINGVTRSVANYAAVRAFTGTADVLNVGGRSNYFDGAQGSFVLDASDTTSADNDGTILVSANGLRFKRQVTDGVYDAAWWGAVPDAPTSTGIGSNSSTAINSALDAAFTAGVPVVRLRSSAGYMYRCEATLNIRSGVVLEGDNATGTRDNGTTLYFVGLAAGTKTIRLGNTSQDHSALGIRGIAIVGGDSTAGSGVLPNAGPDGVEFLRVKDSVILENVGFKYIMNVFSQPRANYRWVQEIRNVSAFFCDQIFDDWNCNAGQFFNLNVSNVRTVGDISGSNNEFFGGRIEPQSTTSTLDVVLNGGAASATFHGTYFEAALHHINPAAGAVVNVFGGRMGFTQGGDGSHAHGGINVPTSGQITVCGVTWASDQMRALFVNNTGGSLTKALKVRYEAGNPVDGSGRVYTTPALINPGYVVGADYSGDFGTAFNGGRVTSGFANTSTGDGSVLDWLETNAWTPTISGQVNCSSVSVTEATFTRIGKRVLFEMRGTLTLTASTTATGFAFTLPYNTAANATAIGGGAQLTVSGSGFVSDNSVASANTGYVGWNASEVGASGSGKAFSLFGSYIAA